MEETNTNKTIGDNIRNLRLKADLTQTELATQAQCSRDMIAKIEAGNTSLSIDLLMNICKALKCSPNMALKGIY